MLDQLPWWDFHLLWQSTNIRCCNGLQYIRLKIRMCSNGVFPQQGATQSLISGVKCAMNLFAMWAGSKGVRGNMQFYQVYFWYIALTWSFFIVLFHWISLNLSISIARFLGLQPRSWAGQLVMLSCSAGNQWAKNRKRMSPIFGFTQWFCLRGYRMVNYTLKCEYLFLLLMKLKLSVLKLW